MLASGTFNQLEALKSKAQVSVNTHGSRIIVIAGHDDCAGNPATPEEHKSQILKAAEKVRAWKLPAEKIIPVLINKDWEIEVVAAK